MFYVITNDKNYIYRTSTGTIKTTSDLQNATVFTDHVKVKNILNNLPKSLKNIHYYIQELNPSLITELNIDANNSNQILPTITTNSDITLDIGNLNLDEILSTVEKFDQIVDICICNKALLENKLHVIEAQQLDILHSIEFYNKNACEGYKIYKQLQFILLTRRKIKNSLLVIEIINDCLSHEYKSNLLANRLANIKNRKYKVRNDISLFDID